MAFRIQSRWPKWAKWKTVHARPHDERYPFDGGGLLFSTAGDAAHACLSMTLVNAGDFRIIDAYTGEVIATYEGR